MGDFQSGGRIVLVAGFARDDAVVFANEVGGNVCKIITPLRDAESVPR